MTSLFPDRAPAPSPEDRLAEISARIVAAETTLNALYLERSAIRDEIKVARLDRLIAGLPAEVLDMLRQPRPRAEDMRRLAPRGLARSDHGGGGRFARLLTRREWTSEGHDVRRRMGVVDAGCDVQADPERVEGA